MQQPSKTLGRTAAALAIAGLLTCALAAQAQVTSMPTTSAPLTRMQAKMDRDEFLKTHRWDAVNDTWSLKDGVEPPEGVKTRAEVKAERDLFLRNNEWDPMRSGWRPKSGTPRNLSTMSRAQVKSDTVNFMRTHRFDEPTQTWVTKVAAPMTKP